MTVPAETAWGEPRHACYGIHAWRPHRSLFRNARGSSHDAVPTNARAIVCLSELAAQLFRSFGVDGGLIEVPPNWDPTPSRPPSSQAMAAGCMQDAGRGRRASVSWCPLARGAASRCGGDGRLLREIEALGRARVRVQPALVRAESMSRISDCKGLAFPSSCFEMQPRSSSGRPRRGCPGQGMTGDEIVRAFGCGSSFDSKPSPMRAPEKLPEGQPAAPSLSCGVRIDEYPSGVGRPPGCPTPKAPGR